MKNIFILLILFSTAKGFSQNKVEDSITTPKIAVLAAPQKKEAIFLRWAATTPRAWRKSNQYGYQLKRYTIIRDGKMLPKRVEKDLGIFKPKPLDDWMKIIEQNDNAAVVAQALFGESFAVTGTDKLTAIVNLSEEQQQRFTWALYVADQDFNVAQMAGLGFVDATAKSNEKYLYKVTSMVPKEELVIKDGGAFIGLQDYEVLPKPLDLAVVFLDKKTMLSWNYAIHKQLYNSYFVERSEDGINFNRLNKQPLTSLNNSNKTNLKRMFYLDSIVNNKKYYYRVKGRTAFGELGPSSDTISGIGKKVLEYVPRITNKNYFGTSGIVLEWEFPKEGNEHITGFELNRSDRDKGPYEVIIKDIPPDVRKIKYDSLQPTNYMTITAIGKNGGRRTSFSALVQPVDSIPPVKPIGLEGKVDSLGIVTLKWIKNTEKDMLGYRVFRGNNKNEEFSQITVSPHRANVYYDSISIKNLNSKVFYHIVAVDKRYNGSEPSDILAIKKPDVIPPTQAVFKSYKIKDNKVLLTWAKSSSEDVVKHEIYRKDSVKWKLIHIIEKDKFQITNSNSDNSKQNSAYDSWTDTKVQEGKPYSYTIIAIDDSGLKSEPSPALNVIIPKTSLKPPIKRFSSTVDKEHGFIELFWKTYKETNVYKLAIYKGIKDKPITLWRKVLPTTKHIVDSKVKPNNEYIYMIRAVFNDGTLSKMNKLNVKY
jgi:fibronectin type 3 domain-containing protein